MSGPAAPANSCLVEGREVAFVQSVWAAVSTKPCPRGRARDAASAAQGARGGHESARNAGSGSLPTPRISFRLDRKRPSISAVEPFPRRIQITFGGDPRRKLS